VTRLLPFAAACVLAACDNPFSHACTANIVPGLVVKVHDATTGAAIAAGAVGIATDGAYRDSLRVGGMSSDGTPESLAGADERAGTYTVQVSKAGYDVWSESAIRVSPGTCHVQTVVLTANLTVTP
jgi:hypothetical protein